MKKVIYKKRPAPWNWGAFDEIGIICAAPTKKECQQKLSSMRKNGRYNIITIKINSYEEVYNKTAQRACQDRCSNRRYGRYQHNSHPRVVRQNRLLKRH